MKINVGIVGYGNLGKALEHEIIKSRHYNLVAIFSRRLVVSPHGTLVEPYDNFVLYKRKISIMFLCGGSASDIEIQAPEIAKYFHSINSFDTHSKIKNLYDILNKISSESKHISILSCGWDPGLFSNIRATLQAISTSPPITFWGKGISMGHSDALRRTFGVDDGVQFTIPNPEAEKFANNGFVPKNIPLHLRDCHIVSHDTNHAKIEKQIKSIPNYFKDQPVTVYFENQKQLLKLKRKTSHKGRVISVINTKPKSKMVFSVSMQSNPHFTAKIMLAYAKAIINFKRKKIYGAFLPTDIPASFLFLENEKNKLFKLI